MTLRGLIVFLLAIPLSQSADLCYKGSRLYTPGLGGPDVCVPCQHGQFMPLKLHTHRQCFSCTGIENPQLEIFISPCNITHDTEIHCIHGFYRTQPSYPQDRGHCQRCTQCQFPKRPCQQLHDTVCCHGDDYGVYLNKDGHPQCIRQCDKGQFLDTAHDQCLPCPSHTYMEETKHINNYCKHCQHPTSEREKIVQPCNSTHSTVIDCADGYSRHYNNMPNTDHAQCLKLCGRGQFLHVTLETCLTCPENTYMDEDRHSYTHCKQCQIPKTQNERILQPCTSTDPALIGCVDGFYRRLSDDMLTSTCERCRNCSHNKDGNIYEGRACDRTRNTVCCSRHGMTVVETLDGPFCVFLPTELKGSRLCGEGEYLSTDSLTCQPCPQGTYMDETQHTNSSCKSCAQFPSEKFCPISDHTMSEGNINSGLVIAVVVQSALVMSVAVYVMVYKWRNPKRKDLAGGDEVENIALVDMTNTGQIEMHRHSEIFMSELRFMDLVKAVQYLPTDNLQSHYAYSAIKKLATSLADLTVLVNVEGSSAHRPEVFPGTDIPYPYSGKRDRGRSHTGSGWVEKVQMYRDLPCPCGKCQKSAQPVTSWGEIVICTATSVVFDETEGRKCQCYFLYDKDDTDLKSCPSVRGDMKVWNDTETDWCHITFVTHDTELVVKLQKTHTAYQEKKSEVRELRKCLLKYYKREENPLALIASHPNGGPKKISMDEVRDPLGAADPDKYIKEMCIRYDGVHVCILNNTEIDDLDHSHQEGQWSNGGSWSGAVPGVIDLPQINISDKKNL